MGEYIHNLEVGKFFVFFFFFRQVTEKITVKGKVTQSVRLHQSKNFCTIKKMNRQATDWEKVFAKHKTDKAWYSAHIKNFDNNEETNT